MSSLQAFVNSNTGDVAEWLGMGLQSPVTGFDSRRRLNCLLGHIGVWYDFGTTPWTLLHGVLVLNDAQTRSSASDDTNK